VGPTKSLNLSIIKRGDVYYVSGPTWFFAEARFGIEKNALIGSIMSDIARLEKLAGLERAFRALNEEQNEERL